MSRPKELVCSGKYKAHDYVKGVKWWFCLGCEKVRPARRRPSKKESDEYLAYFEHKRKTFDTQAAYDTWWSNVLKK